VDVHAYVCMSVNANVDVYDDVNVDGDADMCAGVYAIVDMCVYM